MSDRTSWRGILAGPVDGPRSRPVSYPLIDAVVGLVATHLGSRFRGAVQRIDHDGGVVLRSPASGSERVFRMYPGAFAVDGAVVTLVRPRPRPRPSPAPMPATTASGSVVLAAARARVARPSRLLVEGAHDAELVEKVWGDDLRAEGIVVEHLGGIDLLGEVIRRFRPDADARLGVLVDHLLPGTKEWRIVEAGQWAHVRVTGTPFVDVWQAIKPGVVGLQAWPVIERGRPWKEGICEAFGEPVPGRLWKRLLGAVRTYTDLEPVLVGAVESLIDFVTTGE